MGSKRDEFADAADERYLKGLSHYRGGDPEAAFVGDPLSELLEELLDSRNYTIQERTNLRRLSPEAEEFILKRLREVWCVVKEAEVNTA